MSSKDMLSKDFAGKEPLMAKELNPKDFPKHHSVVVQRSLLFPRNGGGSAEKYHDGQHSGYFGHTDGSGVIGMTAEMLAQAAMRHRQRTTSPCFRYHEGSMNHSQGKDFSLTLGGGLPSNTGMSKTQAQFLRKEIKKT